MAARSSTWMLSGGFHRVMFMYLLLVGLLGHQEDCLTVNAQSPDAGARYLDRKELEVKVIAMNATLNNANCGSFNGCSFECSRVTCHQTSAFFSALLQCASEGCYEFYAICPRGSCGVTTQLVDYSRSFVTLPAPASTNLRMEVAQDICLQRKLDSTFKNVSFPSEYRSVYFASTSGAFRAFPGRETRCTSFDPRKRPWYLNGISVSKDVKILVDVANGMGNLVTPNYRRPPQTTYLDVTKAMILELLQTFSPQDYVEVFSFDSGTATSLGGAVQVTSSYDYLDPVGSPGLAALVTGVSQLTTSPLPALSDLNGAILKAVSSFNQLQSSKVIIVLSKGLFVVSNISFPSLDLQTNQTKLMIYKLPSNDDGGDPFLLNTSLQKDICSVNGSFESLDALATGNPLYSLRSYFTYLARIQLISVDNNATWSYNPSYSQVMLGIVVSLTYPAFGSDGLLIGVAGIDVIIDNLVEPLRTLVIEELKRRIGGILQAPVDISMACYYQNKSTTSVCPDSPPPNSSAICPRTDFSSTLADRTCCRTCGLGSTVTGSSASISLIALIISIAVVAIIAIAGIYYKCKTRTTKISVPVEEDLLYLNLSEFIVHIIEDLVYSRGSSKRKSTRNLLNQRQCMDMSSKLSKTTHNIREIVFHCSASVAHFRPALEKLYQDLEKAKLLVNKCAEEDWCRASVFQIHNEIAFREILLDVGLCYNAIYEQAKSTSEERNLPEDLRQSTVFTLAPQSDVHEDQLELQQRLETLAGGHRVGQKQCLAKYLLVKMNHTCDLSEVNTLDTCSTILWAKKSGASEIWGNSRFLGSGSGASGVCSTKWMGIPCAKKEFHFKESEPFFLKEASILAHLRHPCIVNFICCGNGELKGDRFIAMELMERSLFDLIEDQGTVYFSLPVVLDIMVQIARGMCYLHGQRIAHRDLKPQNVVVNTLTSPYLEDHFCVKLVDFGLSKTKVQVSMSNSISLPGVGTTIYRAPEVHPKAHPDGIGKAGWFKADVFSFAMTCAHVLSLKKPFGDTNLNVMYKDMIDGIRPELPEDCPQELDTLLRDCWDTNPRVRPSFVEICTRLEGFRHKILRGFPTSDPSLQPGRSDATGYEFIKVKIEEHSKTCIQRPFDAISGVEVEDIALVGLPIRGKMRQDKGPKFGETSAPRTSVEMTQRSSRERSFSF